jgi:hypothetical protein
MGGCSVKRVVEVYGELPWRKNLHGSLDLSLFGGEDGRRCVWGRREREEKFGFAERVVCGRPPCWKEEEWVSKVFFPFSQ